MIKQEVLVKNKLGIHARPAALIVQTAGKFSSAISLVRGEDRINAKSILGVIALGAAYKTKLIVEAEGVDEEAAVKSLVEIFSREL